MLYEPVEQSKVEISVLEEYQEIMLAKVILPVLIGTQINSVKHRKMFLLLVKGASPIKK